jgi:hypothetical protein
LYPKKVSQSRIILAGAVLLAIVALTSLWRRHPPANGVNVQRAAAFDLSAPLAKLRPAAVEIEKPDCDGDCGDSDPDDDEAQNAAPGPPPAPAPPVTAAGAAVEQTAQGTRPAAIMLDSFDGLGSGFTGPQGTANVRNPSDNSLAVGPDQVVQIVNSRLAIFDKKGKVLYGPVVTNTIFSGFGGQCEKQISGDAVVRYDQLAGRWLYVLPVFRRPPGEPQGPYSMCYAISQGPDPLGPYHRYEFKRTLFPDYPRPAIWPDGYYIPTSTGDTVIQKHACVADRTKMLQGLPATEQCVIVDGSNFLNNADIDGQGLPPAGAPNIIMAAGGTQLKDKFGDDGIYIYKLHVDWNDTSKTALTGPVKIGVAPYQYLCNGQLTNCVPQPGTERRLDAQGDKLMQRLVYRNIDGRESIVALHSVNTKAGGGGVRWYEFRLDQKRDPYLFQQSTYAPDGFYRWMGSMAMDHQGNIGIGYSFGGTPNFAGQRFAARLAEDPSGSLTLHETVMVQGAAPQTNTLRWEDYTTTAMDPADDCTFWYVGDYLKAGATGYTSRIASFRAPGCLRGMVSGSVYFDRNHDGQRQADEPGLAGRTVEYGGAQSGKLTADSSGRFVASLPADPAYFEPVYSIAGRSVQLKGGENLTGVDIGKSCVVKSNGSENARFWLSAKGKAALSSHDAEWRSLINAKLHLVNRDGKAFRVDVQGDTAYEALRKFLNDSSSKSPAHLASVQVLLLALNTRIGKVEDQATVHDLSRNDWPAIRELLERADASPEKYMPLLSSLNRNAATVTPANPGSCPAGSL